MSELDLGTTIWELVKRQPSLDSKGNFKPNIGDEKIFDEGEEEELINKPGR